MKEINVQEYISYDPVTGYLTWVKSPAKRVKVGDKVSSIDAYGYLVVSFRGSRWKAHRLAWFLYYGEWPKDCIDHINGTRSDNRIQNLRVATKSENLQNMQVSGKGSSIYKGVSWHKSAGKWAAHISVNNRKRHLGCFTSQVSAAIAYNEAATMLYGDYARLNNLEKEYGQ